MNSSMQTGVALPHSVPRRSIYLHLSTFYLCNHLASSQTSIFFTHTTHLPARQYSVHLPARQYSVGSTACATEFACDQMLITLVTKAYKLGCHCLWFGKRVYLLNIHPFDISFWCIMPRKILNTNILKWESLNEPVCRQYFFRGTPWPLKGYHAPAAGGPGGHRPPDVAKFPFLKRFKVLENISIFQK